MAQDAGCRYFGESFLAAVVVLLLDLAWVTDTHPIKDESILLRKGIFAADSLIFPEFTIERLLMNNAEQSKDFQVYSDQNPATPAYVSEGQCAKTHYLYHIPDRNPCQINLGGHYEIICYE